MGPLTSLDPDRDAERRAVSEATAEAWGLKPQRLPALTPDTMPPDTMPPGIAARFQPDAALMPAVIGRFASHLAAWMQMARHADGRHIVCEGDACLRTDPEGRFHIVP